MKRVLILMGFVALVLGACDTNRSVPLDQIAEPVAFVNTPVGEGESASRSDRELAVLDASSGETWQLTSDWANDAQPAWSPSGTHLMFISGREIDSNGPIPPWPTSTGINKLFVYDLEAGTIQHVDLSWARESGPAMPQESEESMKTLGWLECAAWSPIDSTMVAIGVTVESAHWNDPTEKNKMIDTERRVVLLDLEKKTGRFLASYHKLCGGLDWSRNGEYLIVGGIEKFKYLKVDTGEAFSLNRSHTIKEDSLYYGPIDWGTKAGSLLVRGINFDGNADELYRYNVEADRWSNSLARFADTNKVVEYVPRGAIDQQRDFIVLRWSRDTYRDDLWRYHRPEGMFNRLTNDGMPKLDVSSYHGQ